MAHDDQKIALLKEILEAELAEIELLGGMAALLGQIVALLTPPTPVPATILLTDPEGVPVSLVSLTGTQSSVVAITIGDADGNPISGDVLDPGSGSVTVSDGTIVTAVLSTDQTTVTVTAENTTGSATVTVNGTSGGNALTDFGGPLDVSTTATSTAATIILTPGAPQGS